ncbi:MAG: hypothetical protein H6744_01135 [Deltaproteobacteria bacterium]|nr:hypothetical protein [Deltaproteobacteria bacterium]MCB9785271.1 hypothetical protein [Deltaproteobacteria bacterium]
MPLFTDIDYEFPPGTVGIYLLTANGADRIAGAVIEDAPLSQEARLRGLDRTNTRTESWDYLYGAGLPTGTLQFHYPTRSQSETDADASAGSFEFRTDAYKQRTLPAHASPAIARSGTQSHQCRTMVDARGGTAAWVLQEFAHPEPMPSDPTHAPIAEHWVVRPSWVFALSHTVYRCDPGDWAAGMDTSQALAALILKLERGAGNFYFHSVRV